MIVELNVSFLEVKRRVAFDEVDEDARETAFALRTIHILEPDDTWVTARLRMPPTLRVPSYQAAYLMTLRVKAAVKARETPVLYYSDIIVSGTPVSLVTS